jgi:hypothetical protein
VRLTRVSDNAPRKLIKGTFLATLLPAAMEGDLSPIVGAVPTVVILVFAELLH